MTKRKSIKKDFTDNETLDFGNESVVIERLIGLAADAANKARQKELNRFNLDIRWSAILWTIEELGDNATPVMIARQLVRQRHTMSHMLGKMEKAKIITKVRDLDRKNRVRAALTLRGRNLYNKLIKRASIKRITSPLTSAEQQELIICLQTLYDGAMEILSIKPVNQGIADMKQDFYLFKLLVDTADAIAGIRKQELDKYDIGVRRTAALIAVKVLNEKASPAEIARYLQRNCNTVTSILSKLKIDGLITISRNYNGTNRYNVSLTGKGNLVLQQSTQRNAVAGIILSLPKERLLKLKSYLQLLHQQGMKEIKSTH